jgi:hypothetical protein
MQGSSPCQVRTVRGTPIQVYGRTLTPVTRVVSVVRHRGTIRQGQIEGTGGGAAYVRPLAIIEADNLLAQDGDGRTVAIPDATATVLRQMAMMALVVPVLCIAVAGIARWIRNR